MKAHVQDDLVRSAAPVHDDALTGFARLPQARRLLARITAVDVTAGEATAAAPRRSVAHWPMHVAVACGLAAVFAAGGLLLIRGGPGPAGTRVSEVARVTRLAADRARSAPDLHPRGDQYIHVRSVEVKSYADVFGAHGAHRTERLPRTTREVWKPVDGHRDGLLRQSPCGHRRSCDTPLPGDGRSGPPTAGSAAALRSLPTDPDALARAIDRIEHGPDSSPRPDMLWQGIDDLIGEQYLPPKVRAAVFELVGRQPGATVDRHATDAIGRPGIAIAVPTGTGGRNEMIFDPRTYEYLGSRSIAGPPNALVTPTPGATPFRLRGGLPKGTVTYAFAVLKIDVVDHLPAH